MTEQQKQAVEALLQIECKIYAELEQCEGPWCTARTQIREAFGYPAPDADADASQDEDVSETATNQES